MLFNTTEFLFFFVTVLVIYWILPNKIRYIWLLLTSYFFYSRWNLKYCLLLLFVTLIAYAGGIIIQKIRVLSLAVLIVCLILCLGVLGIFKYLNLGIQTVNRILVLTGSNPVSWTSSLILPVGISFFTLQAVGYMIDVYRGDTYAEKNIIRFALFISFFPQLVAGPIERSKNLLKQLAVKKEFNYDNLRKGLLMVLWGLYLKMVIADRAAIFVDAVYGDYQKCGGLYIILATVLFSIQIYCDFHGYSTIARGAALTMGYSLVENFNAPYFSRSVKEFWRRWHISLSSWFLDYLYIPLGGNRKGAVRKNINLMLVFTISGLWHGATLAYVFWGILNGLYQVISDVTVPIKKRLVHILNWREGLPERILRTGITFSLISFAWLFFRAGGFREALAMLRSLVSLHNFNILFDESIYQLGISRKYFTVLCSAIFILFLVDYRKYKGKDVIEEFFAQSFWFRCLSEIVLTFSVLLFGCYGELYDAATFIYFQF